MKHLLYFLLNLLFAISGCIGLPMAGGVWIFGYLWVNAPLDYVPNWLWILTGICLPLYFLRFFKKVRYGWGNKLVHFLWFGNEPFPEPPKN